MMICFVSLEQPSLIGLVITTHQLMVCSFFYSLADGSGAGTIPPHNSVVHDLTNQVEIPFMVIGNKNNDTTTVTKNSTNSDDDDDDDDKEEAGQASTKKLDIGSVEK
jgi:hypothetical protein